MQYPRLSAILLPLCLTAPVVWAGEFEDQLSKAGISQEAIDILVKQEFSKVEDLQPLTVDSLVDKMGIKYGVAQKIVANFGKKEPQPFEKMSLSDLLNYLVTHPTDENALQALKQSKAVQQAEVKAKTTDWAVVGMTDRKLDVLLTMAYLEFLTQSPPLAVFRDKAVVSIDVALGKTEEVIREHPLLDEKLGSDGVDSNNLNWLKVPVEVRKALYWAKITTHPLFPTNPQQSVFDFYEKATQTPPSGIMQKIATEYQAAVLRKDPAAVKVQALKMPE